MAGAPKSHGPTCSRSILRYDPHRVDDAWDIAKDRQQDVYPKLLADSYLQKHSQRRENNRGHDAPKIHPTLLSQDPNQIRCPTSDTLPTNYKSKPEDQSSGPIHELPRRGLLGNWAAVEEASRTLKQLLRARKEDQGVEPRSPLTRGPAYRAFSRLC